MVVTFSRPLLCHGGGKRTELNAPNSVRSALLPHHLARPACQLQFPLRFAAEASSAEVVASPATQLRVGELIPPDHAGGFLGVTLQVALASVHRRAVALSFHAGRCAGLGAGRRTMLGSITTSVRPPTSTRCSILSRRTSLILRFPSSWTDSITPTRCDALPPRSHLSMFFLLTANAAQSSHQLWSAGARRCGSARHPLEYRTLTRQHCCNAKPNPCVAALAAQQKWGVGCLAVKTQQRIDYMLRTAQR